MRERRLISIYKNYLQNMAIQDADPARSRHQTEKLKQVASTLSNGFRSEALDSDTTDCRRCRPRL